MICICGLNEGANLDCDRCEILRNRTRIELLESIVLRDVKSSKEVAEEIKQSSEATA